MLFRNCLKEKGDKGCLCFPGCFVRQGDLVDEESVSGKENSRGIGEGVTTVECASVPVLSWSAKRRVDLNSIRHHSDRYCYVLANTYHGSGNTGRGKAALYASLDQDLLRAQAGALSSFLRELMMNMGTNYRGWSGSANFEERMC